MDRIINLKIERLPEGVWLATSDDVQGLVVQAPTLGELVSWSQEIARDLMELHGEMGGILPPEILTMPVVIAA